MQRTFSKTLIWLSALWIALSSQFSFADEWTLKKQSNGVTVYSRDTGSNYQEVLANTVVVAHPHALIHLLNDVESSVLWIYNCQDVKVLQQFSDLENIVHTVFNAPWPVKDRDMLTYSRIDIQDTVISIEVSDRSSYIDTIPGDIRMQDIKGQWRVEVNQDKTLSISYQGSGSPAGNIPTWLANMQTTSAIFETFKNLRERITLEKYQVPHIPN